MAQTLQTYVSQLRKAIGAGRVVTQPGGYALVVDATELDATQFEAELTDGRDALARATRTAQPMRCGVRWRGGAVRRLPMRPARAWAATEIVRLEEVRLVATESLIEARPCARRASRRLSW